MSTPTIPETHRAVTATTNPKGYKILEKPLPVVADDEIPPQHGLESGDVVYVGNNAEGKGVKLGDPVAGFTAAHRFDPANAAFQEYIKTRPESVFMVPTDKISYQQAAPFGVALSTSVQGLYEQLDLPWSWAPAKEAFPILVWGGFTAVGIYAIKLAKLSGLLVAT
ncbi:hypothetical protein FRB98_008107 [Tulasnella sp. 332]|nr:hypothetical protein FRB98_008107 [Tulasnella sp. 332]